MAQKIMQFERLREFNIADQSPLLTNGARARLLVRGLVKFLSAVA